MASPRKFGPINRRGRSRSALYRADLETINPAQLSVHAMRACGRLDSEAPPCRASWVLVHGEPRPVCHVPSGGGCGAEGAVPKIPPPHRWTAAGPFAAMTAAHPVASGSPDRTGVCCAGRSAPSRCERFTGLGFSSPNQPDQERTTAYRARAGPDSRPDAHCATIVGNWEEPSGESRLNRFRQPNVLPFSANVRCYLGKLG